MKLSTVFVNVLILVYGLSITGYALLDSTHELLHSLKSNLHNHTSHHDHHHVEDHQEVFTPEDNDDVKTSVKIFSFLLFYHPPLNYSVLPISTRVNENGIQKKLLTLTKAPLTPPPLG